MTHLKEHQDGAEEGHIRSVWSHEEAFKSAECVSFSSPPLRAETADQPFELNVI